MKWLRRVTKIVLFLMGVAFVAFWAWVMWDASTVTGIDFGMMEIPKP